MQPILVRAIIEMLGAPKEYIEETLKNYIEKLKKEGLEITNEKFEEAQKQEHLFSTFAELEIKFENMEKILDFCFDSMPSSIEILEPESLTFDTNALSHFLNDLQARLHEADMVVKTVRAQKSVLDKNVTAVFQNFIMYACKEPKSLTELSELCGVKKHELLLFIKNLTEEKKLVKEDDKYKKNE